MGSKNTKPTVSQEAPPSWATGLQQTGLGAAYGAISPYLTAGYGTAPMNADTAAAYEMIRQNAGAPPSVTYNPVQAAQLGPSPTVQAAQGEAAQVGGGDIRRLLNPYTKEVVNTTLDSMRDQQNQNLAGIQARQAAAHSFAGSGSRAALQTAQSVKDFNSQVASTTAQLMSAGYDKATATALANAQMYNTVGMANTAAQNQVALANAGFKSQYDLANAGYQQQGNVLNAAGLNNAQTQNIGYQQAALNQLLGIGQTQEQKDQAALNRPLTAATSLAGILPTQVGGTKTTKAPPTGPSTLQTILGLAGTVGGAALGGPAGAGVGSALGSTLGSLFNPPTTYTDPNLNDPLNWT